MENLDVHILIFFIPLIIANVLHMIIVKVDLMNYWALPLSESLFGRSKTYRGFIVLPILTGIMAVINYSIFGPFGITIFYAFFIGLGLGITYLLFELPNSYFKRRLGIASGEKSRRFKAFQFFVDKIDSLLGVLLFYFLFMPISFYDLILLFIAAFFIHITISYLLVLLRIKRSI